MCDLKKMDGLASKQRMTLKDMIKEEILKDTRSTERDGWGIQRRGGMEFLDGGEEAEEAGKIKT